MKLKTIFGKNRIVGLAGNKHTGKTNNLVSLIKDFRGEDKKTSIYAYGLPLEVMRHLKKLNVEEVSSLSHLLKKKDCILILDEFQKLKLNDRRYKDDLAEVIDFVYHNNIYLILSSPNIREFNSIIGGVIERWLLKDVNVDQCVSGSQLKKVVEDYKGRYKLLKSIDVPVDKLLLINEDKEILIHCDYVPEADSKKDNIDIFSLSGNCQEKRQEIVIKK